LRRVKNEYGVAVPENLEFGGVVGVVDCVKQSGSRWHFRGSWGWVIANPRRLPFRKCKGAVGFFKLKSHQRTRRVMSLRLPEAAPLN
jgi:hypothetical protein